MPRTIPPPAHRKPPQRKVNAKAHRRACRSHNAAPTTEAQLSELFLSVEGRIRAQCYEFGKKTGRNVCDLLGEANAAFMRAVDKYDWEDPRATFAVYLFSTVNNALVDFCRKGQAPLPFIEEAADAFWCAQGKYSEDTGGFIELARDILEPQDAELVLRVVNSPEEFDLSGDATVPELRSRVVATVAEEDPRSRRSERTRKSRAGMRVARIGRELGLRR